MGKVTQTNNGDSGLVARTNYNEALKSVAISDIDDGTAGEVITWDAAGNSDTVSAGTTNYVLTANGVGAAPSFQDPSSNPLVQTSVPAVKSYTYKSRAGTSGIEYIAGYYEAPAADANLTQASTTQTYGTANVSYAAHAFIVAGGAGTASGGSGAVTITVTGTSITDAGVRTAADSEIIVADITAMATDQYIESPKKWIGQITFTLDVGATGHTAYAADFNYGLCKYDDMGNTDFQINGWEFVGLANATDAGFNMEVFFHNSAGWTYSAAAFEPAPTSLGDMNTDHNTEINIQNGEYFAWKRTGLTQDVNGDSSEGIVIKITTSTNNAIDFLDCHIQFLFQDTLIT